MGSAHVLIRFQEMSKTAFRGTDEVAKTKAQKTLLLCLETGFRLLHPFMPFVSEELWQHLPCRGFPWSDALPDPPSIVVAPWPKPVRVCGCMSVCVLDGYAMFPSSPFFADAPVRKPSD